MQLTVLAVGAFLLLLQTYPGIVDSQSATSSSSSPKTKNATTVTYPGIGTFNQTEYLDLSSSKKSALFLPFSPSTINPIFQLYTRANRASPQNISWNSTESLTRGWSNFDSTKLTKIIVHGYSENPSNREWMHNMKNAFLERMNVNVIIVDWSGGNKEPYGQAVANSPVVGPMLAIQFSLIQRLKRTSLDKFHLLCQSLGAHVCGFAGKFLNGKLGQITGLDPARPAFKDSQPKGRLWYTDAKFVDVIHTDAKPLIGYGLEDSMGTVDIWANGGKIQPGCGKDRIDAFVEGGISEGYRTLFGCEHYRGWVYYIAAIRNGNNPKTLAYRCADYETFNADNSTCRSCGTNRRDCVYLGPKAIEYTGTGNRINFYLNTGREEPYFG